MKERYTTWCSHDRVHWFGLVVQDALEAQGYGVEVEKAVETFGNLLAGPDGIKEFLSTDKALCQLFKLIGKSTCWMNLFIPLKQSTDPMMILCVCVCVCAVQAAQRLSYQTTRERFRTIGTWLLFTLV